MSGDVPPESSPHTNQNHAAGDLCRAFKRSPERCPAAVPIMERSRANPKPYLTFTPTKITQILHKRYQIMISVNPGIFYTAYCKKSRIKNSERKKREERGILL